MTMFKKHANFALVLALFVAAVPAYGMKALSTETALIAETVESTETPQVTPVVWYKNIDYLQGGFVAACMATVLYVIVSKSNNQLAIAESLHVEPKTEVQATAVFNNMAVSFKEFGQKIASILQQYDFDRHSVNPDMISSDELAERCGYAIKQAINQQYDFAQ